MVDGPELYKFCVSSGFALHPLDRILQAMPHLIVLFIAPMHFYAHDALHRSPHSYVRRDLLDYKYSRLHRRKIVAGYGSWLPHNPSYFLQT
ncbi:hypothetical protein LguiB_025143 [Lonicera macranthoides]